MLRTFPWAFVCVLNAILPCATAAQPPSPPKTPAIPAANDVAASGYIIEQQHTRLRFEADRTSRREVSARIRVLNEPAVRQWGQIPLTYASETEEVALKDFQVQKPDGTIAATGPGAVQDLAIQPFEHAQMFLDIRRKLITVPALRPGDARIHRGLDVDSPDCAWPFLARVLVHRLRGSQRRTAGKGRTPMRESSHSTDRRHH